MKVIITSDLHLGSPHCKYGDFVSFIAQLPKESMLILNGDTVNNHDPRKYSEAHLKILDLLREESKRRQIVWITGNHDENYVMKDPGRIEFKGSWSVPGQVYVSHGFDFDNVMPRNMLFIILFRVFHRVRIALGAESVHVAHYAKRFPMLYKVLLRHVRMNAVEYARENGYATVICGHTHFAEEVVENGIRYLNTGAWTEDAASYVELDESGIRLKQFKPDLSSPQSRRD